MQQAASEVRSKTLKSDLSFETITIMNVVCYLIGKIVLEDCLHNFRFEYQVFIIADIPNIVITSRK